jgi:hypothetical protein
MTPKTERNYIEFKPEFELSPEPVRPEPCPYCNPRRCPGCGQPVYPYFDEPHVVWGNWING